MFMKTSVFIPQHNNSSNDFLNSINEFSSEDVKCPFEKKKKRLFTFSSFTTFFMFSFFIGVFVYSLYNISINIMDSQSTDDFYESIKISSKAESAVKKPKPIKQGNASNDLMSLVGGEKDLIDFDVAEPPEYYKNIYNTLLNLSKKNGDVYGWIRINGTVVDYPILLGTDNKYYMSHTYDGVNRRAGSIMADCRTRENLLDNLNLVIYGHCMTDGSMFRCIKDFYDKTSTRKAVAEKMEIEIITLDGVYVYKFFATYRTEDHSYIKMSFSSKDAYYNYLKERVELSPVKLNRPYSSNSRIVSLITCTNVASEPDGRYVLTGIMTEFISF
ncbi:MAG: class B sortase [Ruminococcaceae bacterium]|nr:class B sortase [Oscillospiraceae bacterium]